MCSFPLKITNQANLINLATCFFFVCVISRKVMCIYFVCALSHYFSSYWYWDKLFKFPLFINILSNSIKGLRSFSLLLCACDCTCAHTHPYKNLSIFIFYSVSRCTFSVYLYLFCCFVYIVDTITLASWRHLNGKSTEIHSRSFRFWSLFYFVVVIFCINFIENRDQINWLYTSDGALFFKVNKCIFFFRCFSVIFCMSPYFPFFFVQINKHT